MAKWGEGDPRWIVEERPDATNVNNWHWTEKDATNWSKDKFKELFVGAVISDERGECQIVEVSKVEGEASVNNRKGKLIYFYEWNLKLDWKGCVKGSSVKVKGTLEIPNLSEENGLDDISITVTLKKESNEGDLLKDLMRKAGDVKCRQLIDIYLKSLKEDFVVGMVLPKKDDTTKDKRLDKPATNAPAAVCPKTETAASDKMKHLGLNDNKLKTTSLKLKQSFKCTAQELYNALTIKELVEAFARGPCLLEPVENGQFQLFSGNVVGHFVKLDPPTVIEMKWRFSGWPPDHYSHVTLNITQKSDTTDVSLHQTGIPAQDLDRTDSGWKQYYWESIKRTFGFGATLY